MAVWLAEYIELLTSRWTSLDHFNDKKWEQIQYTAHDPNLIMKVQMVKKWITSHLPHHLLKKNKAIHQFIFVQFLSNYVLFSPNILFKLSPRCAQISANGANSSSGDMLAIMLCAVFIISGENMIRPTTPAVDQTTQPMARPTTHRFKNWWMEQCFSDAANMPKLAMSIYPIF